MQSTHNTIQSVIEEHIQEQLLMLSTRKHDTTLFRETFSNFNMYSILSQAASHEFGYLKLDTCLDIILEEQFSAQQIEQLYKKFFTNIVQHNDLEQIETFLSFRPFEELHMRVFSTGIKDVQFVSLAQRDYFANLFQNAMRGYHTKACLVEVY